jgi:hypothetical protein
MACLHPCSSPRRIGRFASLSASLLAGMLLTLPGCSRAPVLTIRNDSSLTLSNLVVSGSGFSERIGNLPAGGEHRLTLRPRGESGVQLVFDAGSRHVDSGSQGYIEGGSGDRITAIVGTNLTVSVAQETRRY